MYKQAAIISLFLSLLLIPFRELQAQVYVADDGYVEFVSSAPLLEFKGKSNHLTGMIDLDENLIDFYVDLTTIDTGINLRNRHMRDSYLETDEFPFAEFTGSLNELYDFDRSGKQNVTATGVFIIHGVEQDMEISGTLEETNDGMKLDASWTVLLDDHNIRKPRIVFYELADEQVVNISILLKNNGQ